MGTFLITIGQCLFYTPAFNQDSSSARIFTVPVRTGGAGCSQTSVAIPVRILFAAPFGLEVKATVRARTLPLARGLASFGHEVEVLVPPWDTPGGLPGTELVEGVCVRQVPLTGGVAGTVLRMWARVLAAAPDILHIVKPRMHAGACQLLAHAQAWAAAGTADTRTVLDVDDWEQAWSPSATDSLAVQAVLAWQEEWGMKHCHGATAASQWLVRRMQRLNPAVPVLYLPNGRRAQPTGADRTLAKDAAVLWFTRFAEIDVGWMDRFWKSLSRRVAGIRLLVAGTPVVPGLDRPFRELLGKVGGRVAVEWLGYLSQEQVQQAASTARCAVAPARVSVDNMAKCSVRLLDLNALGLPCVVSGVGEQQRYRGVPGITSVPGHASPEDFARTVAEVCADPRPPLGGGVQVQAMPDWTELALHLDRFYRRLTEKGQ